MFRLASAKVRRGFELAKLSGNIFSKILLTGRFWRVGVAIRGAKRGSEGRERAGGAPWAGERAGPEAELRGTVVKGGKRRDGNGRGSEGRRRTGGGHGRP